MEDHIGARIKAFREYFMLTQADLFRVAGIKQTTLSSIESGTEPKAGVISALLIAYPNINPEWLLTGSGTMLRDGQSLAPVAKAGPAAPAKLAEDENPNLTWRYIASLEQQLVDAAEREAWLREMLKKPLGNLTAASEPEATYEPLPAPAPIGPRPGSNKAAAKVVQLWPSVAEKVTPSYAVGQ